MTRPTTFDVIGHTDVNLTNINRHAHSKETLTNEPDEEVRITLGHESTEQDVAVAVLSTEETEQDATKVNRQNRGHSGRDERGDGSAGEKG